MKDSHIISSVSAVTKQPHYDESGVKINITFTYLQLITAKALATSVPSNIKREHLVIRSYFRSRNAIRLAAG